VTSPSVFPGTAVSCTPRNSTHDVLFFFFAAAFALAVLIAMVGSKRKGKERERKRTQTKGSFANRRIIVWKKFDFLAVK